MRRVPLMLCAAFAAMMTFAPIDTVTALSVYPGCQELANTWRSAERRGDYETAQYAYNQLGACRADSKAQRKAQRRGRT